MITKILISWLKKNKVQLETEHTAWKFNVALVLESSVLHDGDYERFL